MRQSDVERVRTDVVVLSTFTMYVSTVNLHPQHARTCSANLTKNANRLPLPKHPSGTVFTEYLFFFFFQFKNKVASSLTMTRIFMSTARLVTFIMAALPSVWSFSPIHFRRFEENSSLRLSAVRYDLGLGKNPPVGGDSFNNKSVNRNVQQAARFWMAPEPAVTYPSPLEKKKPKPTQENVLIVKHDNLVGPYSMRRKETRRTQLDPNTIWVEMMIYNQQVQNSAVVS